MLQFPVSHRNRNYNQHRSFRYYSRQVLRHRADIDIHTSRIMVAMELDEREPLQGALADMFYDCWYDVPFFGERILNQVKEKLSIQTIRGLESCVARQDYVGVVSLLATRWSVLVSPSMSAPTYQLRISSDDSRALAQQTIEKLLDAMEEDDAQYQASQIAQIENEFFAHCTATDDTLAFSLVWWELAKHSWEFDARWMTTQVYLEQKTAKPQAHSESISATKATPTAEADAGEADIEENFSDTAVSIP